MSNDSDNDPSYRYTAPGLAAAHTIADAAAHGSPKARRRARILAIAALAFVVALVVVPLLAAFLTT